MKFISVLFFALISSQAAFADFNREKERAQMLGALNALPDQKVVLLENGEESPKRRALADYFQRVIHPRSQEVNKLMSESAILQTALDRALYNDEAEKEAWKNRSVEVDEKLNTLSTDPEWKKKIYEFGRLAEGLDGDLATYARRLAQDERLQFDDAQKPLLDRLSRVEIEISDISNGSPFIEGLAQAEKDANEIERKFFAGELGFDEAWKAMEALMVRNRTAHGDYVAKNAAKLFQEAAIIRTQLAQSKGFKNWTEYVLATQSRQYADGYKTVSEKIAFLKAMLEQTKETYVRYLEKRVSLVPGGKREKFSQINLLALPDDILLRDFLDHTKAEEIWKTTMLESGFTQEDLANVYLDVFPRANKYSHAYMNNATSAQPKSLYVSLSNLGVSAPSDPAEWNPALIYIVQSFRDKGVDPYETAFHEGGHAMDYAHRKDLFLDGAAYAYVETHSMMMERFFADPDYIEAIGRDPSGKAPSRELIATYLENSAINHLVSLRTQLAFALLDLEVYNRAYDSTVPFVETVRNLYGELVTEARQGRGAVVNGVDWRSGVFATNHFTSGSVRYIGYVLADIAAELSAQKLRKIFKETTGRESFLRQPQLANLVINGYYRYGFLEPFPRTIEKFIEAPYDPKRSLEETLEVTENYCKNNLAAMNKTKP